MKPPLFSKAFAFVVLSTLTLCAADEGAALYKSKCAACHGGKGEGKPAIKAPALKGTTLDSREIVERIATNSSGSKAPHNKGMVTEEQAKAIADHVKALK
jgi:mono/diheme cytochrome c family protein